MERIVLEVDDNVAKKWRSTSARLRAELGHIFGIQIENIIDKKKDKDSIQFFNELREEMANKGLTQEILDDILKDE